MQLLRVSLARNSLYWRDWLALATAGAKPSDTLVAAAAPAVQSLKNCRLPSAMGISSSKPGSVPGEQALLINGCYRQVVLVG
ncbi:hypothetical protein D3C80_1468450 [compost metagenome]